MPPTPAVRVETATPSGGAAPGDPPMIEVRRVGKTYTTSRGPVEALRNASFTVGRGEFVALVGPSGCGKSTLLHMAAGLVEHDTGELLVAGTPARAGRPDTAIMLQRPVLFPWRTVLRNVLLPAEVLNLDRESARRRALELLDLVDLREFADKYPWELSGGMRQRVSLVQTLVTDPQILLMDEPFSAVDEFTRERLNRELADLHDRLGRTTLFVTHNVHEAVFLSDRVVAMKPRPGEVVEIIDVNLTRPRTAAMLEGEPMAKLSSRVRHALAEGGG
jgi:NitT/TauT family transport system ATP-binding protein